MKQIIKRGKPMTIQIDNPEIKDFTLSQNTKIMDALIASTVIMYNMDLYTFNKKNFKYLKQVRLVG
ncbi:type II toxin-antitoxin system VapC family toxin [Sulfurovum sp. bin170]|uniref:type II toxin-antitoxin system VapC family toxin n=1 Tax=Sulfurovum sp. bin170 TaxID=2695268 RepID=UPI0013E0CF8B|nr:type II toxin-antitoxin system VapC family toxin [Sulfurovum sp. bin170]NEW60497.1 type II toxin-antitoxin system VapC family toxin [Sulfurovum sp. bin170]